MIDQYPGEKKLILRKKKWKKRFSKRFGKRNHDYGNEIESYYTKRNFTDKSCGYSPAVAPVSLGWPRKGIGMNSNGRREILNQLIIRFHGLWEIYERLWVHNIREWNSTE